MIRNNGVKTRSISVCATMILSVWLVGCAHMPDNFQFSEEVINKEALSEIKRVALLDVPTPKGIWLGDPGSGVVAGFFGVAAAFATATREGDIITSSEKFSEVTRNEMRNWLEEAGIEVILLNAKRVKKSKMLKNYDQFTEVDVDAILEIAPIRVGFMEKPFSMSDELSPDVALTYRLITPRDNQILIESNVFYSSFPGQYADWTGSKLIGPKDHLFESEESVKEHPEEAARRLKYAITGSTEFISKMILDKVKPASIVKPTGEIDLTGVYSVKITRKAHAEYFCFNNRRRFLIELKQENNAFDGKFLSGTTGKFEGTLDKARVRFTYYTTRCANPSKGEWMLNTDRSSLEGYSGGAAGAALTWELLKR